MLLRRSGRLAAALTATTAALAAGLAACGSGTGSNEAIDKAFSTPIKSATVALSLEMELKGSSQVQGPVALRLNGPFQSGDGRRLPSFDWDISFSGGGQSLQAGLVSTGENAWINLQGTDYEVGRDVVRQFNQSLERARKESKNEGRSLKDFGLDPSKWLKDTEEKGDVDVAGVETTHVSAAVDVGKLLEDLNDALGRATAAVPGVGAGQKLTERQRKQAEEAIKDPKFEVFVGKDDNVLRRFTAQMDFEVPEDQRDQAGGAEGGQISFTIEFSRVGETQPVEAPTNARPLSELTGQLGLLGGGSATP